MKIWQKVLKLKHLIFGPMPLNAFTDYDAYWEKRVEDKALTPRLHRYVEISDRIAHGSSVLDIGCGDGGFLQFLKEENKGLRLYGVDLSRRAVEILHSRGIDGAIFDPKRRLRDTVGHEFDYVVLMEVLEHIHDAEDVFAQALEFQPKSLFVTIPNSGYIIHRLRLMFGGRFPVTAILYHMKEHIRFWTVADFKQWVATFDCEVQEYVGQERTKNAVHLYLLRHAPSLFAGQLIFEIRRKSSSIKL